MMTSLKRTISAVALAGVSIVAVAAGVQAAEMRPAELAPLGEPPAPLDNPTTPEKVELGKLLFFDPRLSGNSAMPCSACHLPEAGWDFLIRSLWAIRVQHTGAILRRL